MASLRDYLRDPERASITQYALGPANHGHYIKSIQGTVGLNSPMPIWSNETDYAFMTHGGSDSPYKAGLAVRAHPNITRHHQKSVSFCTHSTRDPHRCITEVRRSLNR